MTKQRLIIGSRGSDLALWQAHHVEALLKQQFPSLEVTIEIIHTTGDKNLADSLSEIGGKGVFTKEIEQALLDRTIDIAVHSLKDLPTVLPDGLRLGAVPMRASVQDVFLSRDKNTTLLDLPDGASVATGSLRRKAQLLAKRPDFRIVDIRGNVPTRIRKLMESNWDGMVLAKAGLERLDLMEHVVHEISMEWVLPAVGQGALGIECRSDDRDTLTLLEGLEHPFTRAAVTAERALLASLGGGCQVPIGAYGKIIGGTLELSACVAALDGTSIVRGVHTGTPKEPERIGNELAQTLIAMGGKELLEDGSRDASGFWTASDALGSDPNPEA